MEWKNWLFAKEKIPGAAASQEGHFGIEHEPSPLISLEKMQL